MIKCLVCDGDGTLKYNSDPYQIEYLLEKIHELGIKLAVATNSSTKQEIEAFFGQNDWKTPDVVATENLVGNSKPSDDFIDYILDNLSHDIKKEEIAYLGDSWTDVMCASNAYILPMIARYSNDYDIDEDWGLPFESPRGVADFIETFGMQAPPYFGWEASPDEFNGQSVDFRAVLGQHEEFTDQLKSSLKFNDKISVGDHRSLRELVYAFFICQIFFDGLAQEIDYVTLFPSHTIGDYSEVLEYFSENLQKDLGAWYKDRMVLRHTQANKRTSSRNRDFIEQLNTLKLNPDYQGSIEGKTILVLDDFTTTGQSLDAARQLLTEADAEKVLCIAMAKFRHSQFASKIDINFDPYSKVEITQANIEEYKLPGNSNNESDEHFKSILNYYSR